MNVLIVDDEYLELEQLLQLIYTRYPHWNLFTAEDSLEALEIANNHDIRLAMLDIHLSGESGLDLAEKLQAHSKKPGIVIITAYQNFDYAKRAIKLKAIDYIVKPVIRTELYDVLDKFEIRDGTFPLTPMMQRALRFVREHYKDNIHLQDVADFVHVSPNYLSKKFNDEVRLSYKDYLVQVRINQAKLLMTQYPEYTIQYIADAVGFSSQNYFTNSFKKHENRTPTQFRHGKIGPQDE
ncbi:MULTISPECIES: response regulator transcription factor [unclassified Sporolactobacillus]|uniref:response regulator transcription factor n=1 Tax=unclassified Sporolactobacillus TaxID=2628533 RepID=UPI0023680AC5|nr:response regulator [Sporolactobacillus sp. CQH2019]MDD9149020.1 response regulator [Sporolactobacillus sp. CQH2019]